MCKKIQLQGNLQHYTQYNIIVTATKYHATKSIYQTGVENETDKYHEQYYYHLLLIYF